jgi:hypothetical protein
LCRRCHEIETHGTSALREFRLSDRDDIAKLVVTYMNSQPEHTDQPFWNGFYLRLWLDIMEHQARKPEDVDYSEVATYAVAGR